MAKPFFYVCAGLVCLALTHHLGARSATAQAPSGAAIATAVIEYPYGTSSEYREHLAVTEDGRSFWKYQDAGGWMEGSTISAGGSRVTSVAGYGYYRNGHLKSWYALTADGRYFYCRGQNYAWLELASLPAGETPTHQETWGGLKARYRGERGPQGVKPSR